MKKLLQILVLPILLCLVIRLQGQEKGNSLSGRLIDESSGKSLSGLTILLNGGQKETKSDTNGFFLFPDLPEAIFNLSILNNEVLLRKMEVKISEKQTHLGVIAINPQLLIADNLKPATIYDNETIKNLASAFPTNPNGFLEELILRMPDVMNIDGKFYLQGQLLQEVLIDGNWFYVSNNDAVLRNFPSIFVDTVIFFEDVSDAKTATGFDDNASAKAIDLKPKKEYENSLFGRAYAGLGNNERYNMGANINYFKGGRKFSVIQQINNVSVQTFSSYDINNATGSNNLSEFSDRASSNAGTSFYQLFNSISDFTIDQASGVNNSSSFGMSYFDSYSKGSFYGNYFYNNTDNTTDASASRQYFSNSRYNETSNSISSNLNHRFRTKLYYNFSNNAVLKISPRVNIQKTTGTYNVEGEFMDSSNVSSHAFNKNEVDASADNASIAINFIKNFNKAHRTFTVDFYPAYTLTKSNLALQSNMNMGSNVWDTLNTTTNYRKNEITGSADVFYTEPLTENGTLLLGYLLSYAGNKLDKKNQLYESALYPDEELTDILGSDGRLRYMANGLKLMYQYRGKNWRFNPGLAYQSAISDVQLNSFSEQSQNNTFNDLLPLFYFHYSLSDKTNLVVNYTTSTSIPSTDELLNLLNMTNPLNLTEGNPELKQSKNSVLELKYTYMFGNKLSHLTVYAGGSKTQNYIATQNYMKQYPFQSGTSDSISVAINRPVNMNGYANVFGYINYNTRFKSIGTNFNANVHYGFYHIPNMNEISSYFANQNLGGLGIFLNSALHEWFTLHIASNTDYNYISNTLNTNLSKYFKQNTSLKLDFWILKDFLLSTYLVHRFTYTPSSGSDDSYFLWNAFAGYRFLKDKSLEFRVSVNNILDANVSTQHTVTDYYVEDVKTNNVKRYFMASFIYNLNITGLHVLEKVP